MIRAREAATLLLAALDHNEMVARFLDVYAAQYRRPGRADRPGLYREQLERIRRESILATVMRIEAALPVRLRVNVTVRGAKRPAKKHKRARNSTRPQRSAARRPNLELAIPFLDLFREEFFVALGRSLEWTHNDADEFWRDLELYEKLNATESSRKGKRKMGASASGPFVDRVALLLDPSLMEQARREAGKFQLELNAAADRVLRKAFSRQRAN